MRTSTITDQPQADLPERLDLTAWFEANRDHLDPDGLDVEDEVWLECTAADVAALELVLEAALTGQFADTYETQLADDIRAGLAAGVLHPEGFLADDDLRTSAVQYASTVAYGVVAAALGL